MTSSEPITSWQKELLINTLLIRDSPKLAVQALRAPGPPVDSKLQMRALLANGLVIDAFELHHSVRSDELLLAFFKGCHEQAKWNQVLALSLTEYEGATLCKYLHSVKSLLTENLELIYLLQRDKYIEARACYNEIRFRPRSGEQQIQFENTAGKIMSSYELAMNSTHRSFCNQYMAVKDRLLLDLQKQCESSEPLSKDLNPYIYDANSNVDGIFYRAILSAKRVGFSHTRSKEEQDDYIPLISRPRIGFDTCEYEKCTPAIDPKPFVGHKKRRQDIAYEQYIDDDMKQPNAKRKRFTEIGDDKRYPAFSAYLLSTATNQSVARNNTMDDTVEMDDDLESNSSDLQDSINLLSTPVVKSTRLDRESRIESRCQTPQSILKRHMELGALASRRSASPSVHSARRSVDFNERSFRFTATPRVRADNNAALGAIPEACATEYDERSSSTSPYNMHGRRPIHSSNTDSGSNTASNTETNTETNTESQSAEETPSESLVERPIAGRRLDISTPAPEDSPPKIGTPVKGGLGIQGRPQLRSNTPEISSAQILSSTRTTRSHSKKPIDECDAAASTSKYALDTSTPIRVSRSRSPAIGKGRKSPMRLLKAKTPTIAESDTEGQDSGDGVSPARPRNVLRDSSYFEELNEESFMSDASMVHDNRPKRFLDDSSILVIGEQDISMGGVDDVQKDAVAGSSANDGSTVLADPFDADDSVQHVSVQPEFEKCVEEVQQPGDEEAHAEQYEIEQTTAQAGEVELGQSKRIDDIDEQSTQSMDPVAIGDEDVQNESIEPVAASEPVLEVQAQDVTQSQATELDETTNASPDVNVTRPRGVLVDSPFMSATMQRKFNLYDSLNTSSFYNESASVRDNQMHRMLDDSSIFQPAQPVDGDVIQLGDDDDDIESNQSISSATHDSTSNQTSESTSNRTSNSTSNSPARLIYDEESDKEDDDNQNDVIQISSTSDEGSSSAFEIAESQDSYFTRAENFVTSTQQPQQSHAPNADLQYGTESYVLEELQPSGNFMEMDPTQDFNEMIYADLGSADMIGYDNPLDDVGNEEITTDQPTEPILQAIPSADQGFVSQSMVYTQGSAVNVPNDSDAVPIGVESSTVSDERPADDDNMASTMDEPMETSEYESNVGEQAEAASETVPDPTFSAPDDTNVFEQAMVASETLPEPTVSASADTNITEPNIVASKPRPEQIISEIVETTNVLDQAMIAEQSELSAEASTAIIEIAKPTETATKPPAKRSQRLKSKSEDLKLEERDDVKLTPTRRGRRLASQQKDVEQAVSETTQVENTEEKKSRRRAASQQKEIVAEAAASDLNKTETTEGTSRRRRGTSQQKELVAEPSVTQLTESVSEPGARNRRGTSKAKEIVAESQSVESVSEKNTRKRRGASQAKEIVVEPQLTESVSETSTRKRRGASQTKELVPTEEQPSTSKAAEKVLSRRTSKQSTSDDSEKPNTQKLSESVDAPKPAGRRLRKASSQQSLHDEDDAKEATLTFKATKPKRSMSHQSLTTISEASSTAVDADEPMRRPTRAQSVVDISEGSTLRKRKLSSSQQNLSSTDADSSAVGEMKRPSSRAKRTASQASLSSELGERFDAEESVQSRRLRKAVSHQTLPDIDEEAPVPAKKTKSATRPRRAESHQSLSSLSEASDEKPEEQPAPKTPKARKAKEALQENLSESTVAKGRRQRVTSESSEVSETSRTTRKTKKADDDKMEAGSSPSVSTRSRRTPSVDDDSSTKGGKTKRPTRAGSALPAINEDTDVASGRATPKLSQTTTTTRSQKIDESTAAKRSTRSKTQKK